MNVRKKLAVHLFWLPVLLLALVQTLRADVVVLRSGVQYLDVKATPVGELHRILFSDGHVQLIPNSQIRSVKPARTSWTKPAALSEPAKVTNPSPVPVPTPAPLNAQPGGRILPGEVSNSGERPALMAPIVKSAFLPGWGQYSQGREKTGILYGGLTLLAFQSYWSYRQQHAAAERDYNNPLPVGAVAAQSVTGSLTLAQTALINLAYLSQKEKKVYTLQRKGNRMLMVLPILWGWNMLDVLHGGVPWEKRWFQANSSAPEMGLCAGRDSIVAVVRFSL